MDAAQALADLTDISNQITAAVILDEDGAVRASTLGASERSGQVARRALDLLSAADEVRSRLGEGSVTQVHVSLRTGGVFAVRGDGRVVAATTTADPTVGLVLYDLRSCLRSIAEPPAGSDQAA